MASGAGQESAMAAGVDTPAVPRELQDYLSKAKDILPRAVARLAAGEKGALITLPKDIVANDELVYLVNDGDGRHSLWTTEGGDWIRLARIGKSGKLKRTSKGKGLLPGTTHIDAEEIARLRAESYLPVGKKEQDERPANGCSDCRYVYRGEDGTLTIMPKNLAKVYDELHMMVKREDGSLVMTRQGDEGKPPAMVVGSDRTITVDGEMLMMEDGGRQLWTILDPFGYPALPPHGFRLDPPYDSMDITVLKDGRISVKELPQE